MKIFNDDLDDAAENGRTETVIELIEKGMNPNLADSRGRTPLHKAAMWGHTKTVVALIKCGANAGAKNELGETALHVAAEYDQVETVEALLKIRPIIINRRDIAGNTALMWAAENGFAETVKVLIERGADVNIQNDYGCTALEWAGSEEVKKLIENADQIRAEYLMEHPRRVARRKTKNSQNGRQYE